MDSLDAIKQQVNAGDQEGARLALRALLKADPDNADAWALLAILLHDPADQAECYHQILRVKPGDRQAAAWLHVLEPEIRRPSVDSVPAGRQAGDAATREPGPSARDADRFLQTLDLPEVRDETAGQPGDREAGHDVSDDVAQWPEVEPERPGFWGRIRGQRQRGRPEVGSLASALDQEEGAVQPGSLSPENILRMAGGPLPPEERRECHRCGAVVSRSDSRCPWCSAPLLDAGEG